MPVSSKQRKILAFPHTKYDALICDGAIRSGKTSIMTVAFIDDAMRRYKNQRFGICGATVDSAIKNVIVPYMGLTYANKKYKLNWKTKDKVLEVRRGSVVNYFEVFGGKDESSYKLIQGRTLAGVLLDEVALQPRSFVEQALGRCSVTGSRFWFSCNPAAPTHWFKLEWIDRLSEKNAYHIHFFLDDNPALDDKIKNRYKSMFAGIFYRRYILGEWCLAEGLIYDFGEGNITDDIPDGAEYYISIDYGTLNPFSAGLWAVKGAKAVRIKEYYYSGRQKNRQLTDEEYCDAVETLADGYNIQKVVVDPSAASFITALRKRGFSVLHAKNDVLDGIRKTAVMLQGGNIMIHRSCTDAIREFGLYRWDDKATDETVINYNFNEMDDIRYFCNTIMAKRIKNADFKSEWVMR